MRRRSPPCTAEQRQYIWTMINAGNRYYKLSQEFRRKFNRRCPTERTCRRIFYQVTERGYPETHKSSGRKRTKTSPDRVVMVLLDVLANPEESVRKRALRLGIPGRTLHRILKIIKTEQSASLASAEGTD